MAFDGLRAVLNSRLSGCQRVDVSTSRIEPSLEVLRIIASQVDHKFFGKGDQSTLSQGITNAERPRHNVGDDRKASIGFEQKVCADCGDDLMAMIHFSQDA